MKKIIAWLLVLSLTAAISIGATLAYLTDTDEDVNVMTLGKVKIDQLEYERVDVESKDDNATVQEFHDNKPLLPAVTDKDFTYIPGDTYVDWDQIGKDGYTSKIWDPDKINNEVDKMVFIKNKGDYDAFVRSIFAFEAGKYTTLDEFRKMVHLNLNKTDFTWEWVANPVTIGDSTYFVATATYNKVLAPGALTEISLSQIALDKTATNEDVEAFGDTYQILVKSQGIQADGFTDPVVALNEGFGAIRTENIPWESDSPTRGIDLKKALHYYEGGTTQITGSVANVTFGLKSAYPAIVNSDNGTLVDVEQDVPAYAYYVKNGDTYDIYVLSDSTIYAPANSLGLFASMGSLKTVKGKLDVSRVTTMESMFDYCGALQSVDASGWDTGKVTNMPYMFYGCQNLSELDTSSWNLSNVKSMKMSFYNCISLAELDVSGWGVDSAENMNQTFCKCTSLTALDTSDWNTSNVVDMAYLFFECDNLETVDVSGWDVGNVARFQGTFQGCTKLNGLDVSNWDTSSATEMGLMFYGDCALEYLDVSGWDVSKVGDFSYMFASMNQNAGDMKLQNLDLSAWNPASATSMYFMFYGCGQFTELDLSGWNMPKLTDASHMFADCFKLQTLDVSGWQTPSLVTMDGMFNDCQVLQSLDMSSFDTSKVKEFSQLFEACYALEEIKGMGNWDTSSACTFTQMFSGCGNLKELDLSAFNTGNARDNYTDMNNSNSDAFTTMFSGVNKLEKLIVGDQIKYLGNGNVAETKKLTFPNPAAKEGLAAMWRNVETGELYLAKDIPEGVAATYEAYYQYPSNGAKMIDALHYLNANTGSTKITDKVTNVTFGLTKDYPQITSAYTGVLADQGQDGPVYAYYVPKDSNYDIYFLSENVIYAPKDSSGLFMNMKALQKVDTSNFDMSRVESMYNMFCFCGALVELDVSDWDVGNVTTMERAFKECGKLEVLDVENWDMSNVRTILRGFQGLFSVQNLEVGKWDTGNIEDMGLAFQGCKHVERFDVDNWDVSNVKYFNSLFASWDSNKPDMSLSDIDVSKWNTGKAEKLNYMFYGCGSLKEIDLSAWDVSNVTTTYHMFADCNNLTSVNFTGWNTPNLTDMDGMFNDCHSLVSLDVSDIDTHNVEDMSQLFEACRSLKEVKGLENWDTSKVWDFDQFFLNCSSIEVIDLSSLDTSAATETSTMFQSCTSLKTIYVGDGWDMSKVTSSGSMFHNCPKLVGANGTTTSGNPTDVTYARVDTPEAPGYLTYKAPATTNP